jgi:tetratricopeptide (TPR) repeat protein
MATIDRHEKDWSDTISPYFKSDPSMNINEVRRVMGNERARTSGLTPEVYNDLAAAAMQFTREGDDGKGFLVRMTLPGMSSGTGAESFLVAKESGGYKILGAEGSFSAVGKMVLDLVQKGDLEDAVSWLDRVRQELPARGGDDPLFGPFFSRIWLQNQGGKRDANAIRRAAVTLLIESNTQVSASDLAVLEDASTSLEGSSLSIVRATLADAYLQSKQYEKSLNVSEQLLKEMPESPLAFSLALRAAYAYREFSEGRRILDANIERFQRDAGALRLAASVAMTFGDTERSSSIFKRIIDSGRGSVADYNQIAWGELMAGTVTADSLSNANKGMLLAGNPPSTGFLHTLAAVDAELGKTTEARAVLLQRMSLDGSAEPTDSDWYVFGRIAEQYGLKKDAAAMYRKLERPANELAVLSSSYALAQKRLKILESQ